MDVLTPKKMVESSSRCFIRLSATIPKDKIYINGKKLLDVAERIVNDLLTGLRGLPSWFPVATYFSVLSNFNFNQHIFEKFTVDLSLETFFSKTTFSYGQLLGILYLEAVETKPSRDSIFVCHK